VSKFCSLLILDQNRRKGYVIYQAMWFIGFSDFPDVYNKSISI
jgi:hypothetical protein